MIVLIQIVVLLLRVISYIGMDVRDPFGYLYGPFYNISEWDNAAMESWFFNIALYSYYIYRMAGTYQEEKTYMMLVRYQSYRKYYEATYRKLLWDMLRYHLEFVAGVVIGTILISAFGYHILPCLPKAGIAMMLMFFSNLLYGLVLSIFIIKWKKERLGLIVYPCIPVISAFCGRYLLPEYRNYFIGDWGIAIRSSYFMVGGYHIGGVIAAEVVLIVVMSFYFLKVRLCAIE